MNNGTNFENHKWDVRRNAASVKLIRVKLLGELNQRQPGVLTGIIDLASAEGGIVSQQIRRGLILVKERGIVNTTPRVSQRRHQRNVVLRGQSQELLEIILPDGS